MFGALYQSLSGFLDSAAFATIVFAPAKLPLDVGIQHALLGWALCQFMFSSLTEAKASLLTPTSYEAMPFLARFALLVSRDAAPASALATVLVGSVLVNLVSAALLYCLSWAPLGNVNSLLPPALQAGLFAAIGWGLYSLSFETVGLPGDASFLLSPAVLAWPAARLWIPAHVFGVGLWLASRRVSHPALFPAFVLAVCALTHCARLYTGTSLAEAQAQRWLMPHTAGRPCTTLWASMNPGAIRLDLLVRADAAKELLMAAIFGPVVNSLLNLVLIAPVIGQKLAPAPELRAQAAGLFAAGLGGGYASYIAVSNTAIFLKVGAKGRASCYAAAAAALLLFLVHPAFAIVGWVPTLLPAAICVYIGVDFLYDNLVVSASAADTLRTHTLPVAYTCRPDRRGSGEVGEVGSSRRELSQARTAGPAAAAATWSVLALCLAQDMLVGAVLGVLGFRLASRLGLGLDGHGRKPSRVIKPSTQPTRRQPARARKPAVAFSSPAASRSPPGSPAKPRSAPKPTASPPASGAGSRGGRISPPKSAQRRTSARRRTSVAPRG